MFYPSVHDSMERFPHTFVSVKQEPSLPDDNGCISVLRKEQELLELYFADIVLTCIPVIIVYMIGQKYIVGGMTSGAVKE